MKESSECSCGGDKLSGHKTGCHAYALAVQDQDNPAYQCCPTGYIWSLTQGLGFTEQEGAPLIDSKAHTGQYLSNIEDQVRHGNIPRSLPEQLIPAGDTRLAITYPTTESNDGYAHIACVIVSFSLPQLSTPVPDPLFEIGTPLPGPAEPVALAGTQVLNADQLPAFQALEPQSTKKYRFILWGGYRLLSRTNIASWLLQSPTVNGVAVTPRRLKFVMQAVEQASFKVDMVQVGSIYAEIICRLASTLQALGRNSNVSLQELNAILQQEQAVALRRLLAAALIDSERKASNAR